MRYLFLNRKQILICICVSVIVILHFFVFQKDISLYDSYSYSDYVQEYQTYRERVEAQGQSQSQVAIFSQSDSYASENAKKTYRDYQQSENVVPAELHGSQNAMEVFSRYHWDVVASCVVMLVLLLTSYQQRESWFRNLEFSLPRGRRRLAVLKICSVVGIGFSLCFLLQTEVLIVALFCYGGWKDLGVAVQSVPMFLSICQDITLGQFLLIYCTLRAMAITIFWLVFWALLWLIDHKILAVFFWMLALIGEYLLFRMIPIQGRWNGLKLFNLISLLANKEMFLAYRNIATSFGLLEMKELFLLLLIVCGGVGAVLIIWIAGCHNRVTLIFLKGRITKIANKLSVVKSMLEQMLSWVGMELYGYLFLQKGWILCLVMLALTSLTYQKDDIVYAGESQYLHAFYQEWEGPITEELKEYMQNWQEELAQIDLQWQQTVEDYKKGVISFSEYDNQRYLYEFYQVERNCCHMLTEQIARMETMSEETGRQMWLVNEVGYKHLLGEASQKEQRFSNMLFLVLTILACVSVIKGQDNASISLQRACPMGRRPLYLRKTIAVLLVILVFGYISKVHHLLYVARSYGLTTWGAPLQSLSEFANSDFVGNVISFYILKTMGQIGAYLLLGLLLTSILFAIRSVKK